MWNKIALIGKRKDLKNKLYFIGIQISCFFGGLTTVLAILRRVWWLLYIAGICLLIALILTHLWDKEWKELENKKAF